MTEATEGTTRLCCTCSREREGEGRPGGQPQPHLDYFTLPGDGLISSSGNERYYDFVWGDVHFFSYDADPQEPAGRGIGSVQANWLRDQLAVSTSTWNIVYMHHSPFSSSSHGSRENPELQLPYQKWGADAVFSGHDHVYERIIKSDPALGDFPYFISGLGGNGQYGFHTIEPGSEVRYNDDFGAMRVTVDGRTATFEFLSIDDGARGSNGGRIIDSYTLNRIGGRPEADYYRIESNVGDNLDITTLIPAGGPGQFTNDLDVAAELYDPSGTLVASAGSGSIAHTAELAGTYTIRVFTENETPGEYVLSVSGHTGSSPPFEVTSTDPAERAVLQTPPGKVLIDLSNHLLVDSVAASALTVGGVVATDVTIVDGDTLLFTLPTLVEGVNDVSIAAGSLIDIAGQPIEAFSASL